MNHKATNKRCTLNSSSFMKVISSSYGLLLVLSLSIACFIAPFIDYACKRSYENLNPLWLVLALFCLAAFVLISTCKPITRFFSFFSTNKRFAALIGFSTLALLLLQAYIVKTSWFITGWDVAALMTISTDPLYIPYYSHYPNLTFMVGVTQRVIRLASALKFSPDQSYLIMVGLGCISASISCALIAYVAKAWSGHKLGIGAFILSVPVIGLNPWILVPYTDIYSVLCISLLLFVWYCLKRQGPLWISCFVLICLLGYTLKPTFIFLPSSLAIVSLVKAVFAPENQGKSVCAKLGYTLRAKISSLKLKTFITCMCAAVISFGAGQLLINKIEQIPVPIDKEQAFSFSHYLMMGFNPTTHGCYLAHDYWFSESFTTKAERQAANFKVWQERVSKAGPAGIAKLMIRKTCSNYSDGSFSWACEGNFFIKVGHPESFFSKIYGIGIKDDAFLFAPFAQVLWFMCLVSIACVCLTKTGASYKVASLALSLAMISVFLLLFECRARYFILYIPCFILLASLGLQSLATWKNSKLSSKTYSKNPL